MAAGRIGPARPDVGWLTVALLAGLLILAGYLHVDFQYGGEVNAMDVFDAVLGLVIFTLPGFHAVAVAAVGKAVAEALLHIRPAKAAFNVSQWMAAAGTAAAVFAVLGGGDSARGGLLPLMAAMVVMTAVNSVAVVCVLSLVGTRRVGAVLSDLASLRQWSAVTLAANVSLAVLFAAAYAWAPLAALAVPVPLVLLHWSSRGYAAGRVDRARLAGLQSATHALAAPVDPRAGIPQFVEAVRRCFECEMAELVVLRPDGDREVHRSTAAGGGACTSAVEAGNDPTLASLLLDVERAVRVDDDYPDPAVAGRLRGEQWRDCLAAPVRSGRRSTAVLCCYNRSGLDSTEGGELAVLEALAGEVAGALDKAELLEEIAHQAIHDPLTGLPNRRLLLDRLENALVQALRVPTASVAVLFLDLDRFKSANDTHGHQVGDQILVAVARRLEALMRASDTVGRLGGDEFVVVCANLGGEHQAVHIAERVAEAVSAAVEHDGIDVSLSASIGIALAAPGDVDGELLLEQADAAMYQAKEQGRSRYQLFDGHMHAAALHRIKTEDELGRALERGEFRLFYQPSIDMGTAEVAGAEALLRWKHPERGLMSPEEFIDLAEESRLILPIGSWVIHEACREAARWESAARDEDRPLTVSVNLSAVQLAQPGLCDDVRSALSDVDLDPATLCLEITESLLMVDFAAAMDTLQALKTLGIRLSLDDFGTGYSSLAHVHQFPIDELKVDRSFVGRLGEPAQDTKIVEAVVGLAQALNLTTVAEGVETRQQLQLVQALGCDLGQGYYWSAPLDGAEFADWRGARPRDRARRA